VLGDEKLEALLLMNIHKAVLHTIDREKVIDMLGEKSALVHGEPIHPCYRPASYRTEVCRKEVMIFMEN
jgi:hypothetical protein